MLTVTPTENNNVIDFSNTIVITIVDPILRRISKTNLNSSVHIMNLIASFH